MANQEEILRLKTFSSFSLYFTTNFDFFLICPSRALSEFQVSDRKVPCFNRRSRQCELDSIMLFCIDNDRFPQSAKKISNICIKYLNQKLQTGETGTSHLKLIHNPSCWVCLNVQANILFLQMLEVYQSQLMSFYLPHSILSQVCESIETKASFSNCCFTNKQVQYCTKRGPGQFQRNYKLLFKQAWTNISKFQNQYTVFILNYF